MENLYSEIRKKVLTQYFTPFESVDLGFMAKSLNTTVAALESELAPLIMDGTIQARIDSHNKALHAKKTDQRSHIFQQTFANVSEQEKQTRHLLLRMQLMKHEWVVK